MTTNRKKLLILSHYSSATGDGIHDKHWKIAKALQALGWDTDLVVSGDHHWLQRKIPLDQGSFGLRQEEGVRVFYLKSRQYKGNGVGRVLNMAEFVVRAMVLPLEARSPDLVMASLPHSLLALDLLAWKICQPKLPVVTEVRDIWSGYLGPYMGMSSWHPFHLAVTWSERLCLRLSKGLVSSLSRADQWAKSLGYTLPFHTLPFGVTPLPNNLPSLSEELIPPSFKERFLIGYVGGLIKHNHLEPLLDAARLLRDDSRFAFLIVGSGSHERELLRSAEDLPNVRFTGKLPKELVPSLLKRLDLCYKGTPDISVNAFGTSPIKMIEYMAAERPIVHLTNETDELVARTGCGWKLPLDQAHILPRLIQEIASLDPEERARVGRNGRDYVYSTMSYPKLAEELDRYLRGILST